MRTVAPGAVVNKPDRGRPEPLWHQVEGSIRAAVEAGRWAPGARIPGEAELTDLLGVSRITVRHALANLERAGVLRREHGRGTFVRAPRLVAGTRTLTSFSEELAAVGVAVGSQVIGIDDHAATDRIAEALQIEVGDLVVRIRRTRSGDGQLIGVQTAHLRGDRFAGFDAEDLGDGSLYGLLRSHYGVVATDATEVFRVDLATAEDAAVLGVEPGAAVFVVERVASDDRGPFEFTTSTMRGDRYEIRSTLRAT